jgi:predicted RNA-binding Zn-ribbon protein involved in translation (DUF1610 family)
MAPLRPGGGARIVDCPSCGDSDAIKWGTVGDFDAYRCPTCGEFYISGTDRPSLKTEPLELRRDTAGRVWLTRPDCPDTTRVEKPRAAEGS